MEDNEKIINIGVDAKLWRAVSVYASQHEMHKKEVVALALQQFLKGEEIKNN